MTAVHTLQKLDGSVWDMMSARVVAGAEQTLGDIAAAEATIQKAWAPLEGVPPSMLASSLGRIGMGEV